MERLQADLRAYYERQAAKLLDLARECSDTQTAQKLVAMAHEYIEKRSICLTGSGEGDAVGNGRPRRRLGQRF
jgi:hypothetical protein